MEKIDEQWALNSVTSSFKILFRDEAPVCTNQGQVLSEVCGFGWRFSISSKQHNSEMQRKGNILMQTCTFKVDISFDPHLVSHAQLGTLTLSAKQRGQGRLSNNIAGVTNYELSRYSSGSDVRIASFDALQIIDHLLDCTVTFDSSLKLSLPKTISQDVKHLLRRSLSGYDHIDTKFCLFSRRSSSGAASSPLPVYASSYLLKGHASYLDTRQSSGSLSFSADYGIPLVLFGTAFKEAAPLNLAITPMNDSSHDYDYSSDSDLDSESEAGDTSVEQESEHRSLTLPSNERSEGEYFQ
jgi:hypothetical protein